MIPPGRAALAAVLVGATCVAAGCGGGDHRATSVKTYLEQVNLVQERLASPLARVARANQDLRTGKKLPSLRPKLERSAATIRTLELRLDALRPPQDAVRLDALIRRLVHAEWQLTQEFALLARYAPAATGPVARASAAGKTVRRALGATRKPKAQAAALDAYAATLDSVVHDLGQLDPPPVVAPQHRTQLRTYSTLAATSRQLASSLRKGKGVRAALRAVELAASSGSTISAQKARIAGIVAFNGRVKRIAVLAANAQRERNRLQRLLG